MQPSIGQKFRGEIARRSPNYLIWTLSPEASAQRRRRPKRWNLLLQVSSQPVLKSFVPEPAILRLADPVAFIGEDEQLGGHVLALQLREELQGLRIGDAIIHFSGDD